MKQLQNKTSLPNAVISWIAPITDYFDCFKNQEIISVIDHEVSPIGGDISYVIIECNNSHYALVTTDYPDPMHDLSKMKNLLPRYSATHVITPDNKTVELDKATSENMQEEYFIRNRAIYYYCAKLELS